MISNTFLLLALFLGGMLGVLWRHYRIFPFGGRLTAWESRRSAKRIDRIKPNKCVELGVRSFIRANKVKENSTELDSTYRFSSYSLDLASTALILMDVWENPWCEGLAQRTKKKTGEKIVPLLELARKNKI